MPEPSVLDYLKAILRPWRGPAPVIPVVPRGKAAKIIRPAKSKARSRTAASHVPWRSVSAFSCFLLAQYLWAPPRNMWELGVPMAMSGAGLSLWAIQQNEWRFPKYAQAKGETGKLVFRRIPLVLALIFFVAAFFFSGGNQFSFLNSTSWFLAILFTTLAFWQVKGDSSRVFESLKERVRQKEWWLPISRWSLVLLLVFAVIAFFRFSELMSAPPEMTSDHAEKLLDVRDVLNGETPIYFERNTGREALQFYLTAWVSKFFGGDPSFLTLKLGTTVLAFISLSYVYLLGKEFGGRWVGLFALFLTGVAFWPNLLARTGLRFSLYPTLVAPALYYLLRGMRRSALNDFLLSGLFMGIGLHGYTAFRAMPIVALAALAVFWFHRAAPVLRRRVLIGFAVLALLTLVILAPLARYALERPDMFGMRMFSRVFEAERQYPAPVWQILPMNILRGLGMFNFSGGNIWLVGLVRRPAFDPISAALLLLGSILLAVRYLRFRQWPDLFLLISLPLLMLPSTLALAFPEENPAMNRASGAWVPAFLICAIALDSLLHGIRERLGGGFGLRIAQIAGISIMFLISLLNYRLFFDDYVAEYDLYAWNTSELGNVIADYAGSFGTLESAWVVAYPHWVDTRLVAINAGALGRDFGVWPDQLSNTLNTPPPKLFLVKSDDTLGQDTLRQLYPEGLLSTYESRVPGKEFIVFFVPAQ